MSPWQNDPDRSRQSGKHMGVWYCAGDIKQQAERGGQSVA